jgi:hypothetical protein
LRYQRGSFLPRELKHEVGQEPPQVPFDSFVETEPLNAVDVGEIAIEHYLVPADKVNLLLDALRRYPKLFIIYMGKRSISAPSVKQVCYLLGGGRQCMKNHEGVIRIFHSDDACDGIITSTENGPPMCAECGRCVAVIWIRRYSRIYLHNRRS